MGRRDEIADLRNRADAVSEQLARVRERVRHLRPAPVERGPYRTQVNIGEVGEQRALLREEAELMREGESIRRELARIGIHHGLPLLAQVSIASPCPASWEDMRGDGNVRFCSQCSKHVYDLSALTRVEAEALLVRHEGRLCAQVFLRVDGTILTSDCWIGRRRTGIVALCAAASAAALALGAAAYSETPSFSLSADGPCDVGREAVGSGVMLQLSTHAPQSAAVCANPPPDRTTNGRVFRTGGVMRSFH